MKLSLAIIAFVTFVTSIQENKFVNADDINGGAGRISRPVVPPQILKRDLDQNKDSSVSSEMLFLEQIEEEFSHSEILQNVQKKLNHVFDIIKVVAPGLHEEINIEDKFGDLSPPDDVVLGDRAERSRQDGHFEHESKPLIPPQFRPRRGDVVFEDNSDGIRKYRHFDGEPVPLAPNQNQPIVIESEKPSPEDNRFSKILEYLKGFKQVLPTDWDEEYMDIDMDIDMDMNTPTDAEPASDESQGEDFETEADQDKFLEKEKDYRGNVFSNIIGHSPIAKSNKRICHSQQELEEVVLLTIEKVIQAKAADKAKLARLIFGQPMNKNEKDKHYSSSLNTPLDRRQKLKESGPEVYNRAS